MPAAFSRSTMDRLQATVRTLYYRRKQIGRLFLTHEEYIQTFVPAEARHAFREAAPWCAPDNRQHHWELRLDKDNTMQATLRMHLVAGRPCPPPVTRMPRIQGDAPPEISQKIYDWAERGGDASREFGRVAKVLELLNMNFSRVAIRYYWPTILAICSETDKAGMQELVQEMQDMKMPARLRPLPTGVTAACRQAAETIATVRLIPADIDEEEEGDVIIDIVAGQEYIEPFGTFYGMT
jgi:hypothetical protein